MNKIFYWSILLFAVTLSSTVQAQKIAFELDANKTATYAEVVQFYKGLDARFDQVKLIEAGSTDSGKPLHLFIISKDKLFTPEEARQAGKQIILINNGIHPGEPEGIDASMMLARNILEDQRLPDNIVICMIPVYNVGGMLNRGVSRANQNGPDAYGFRGNARNYDLNRDFIKTDTRNSWSFQEIFNAWDPDLFMDTHTSNGADYQYVMTLIDTQRDKLHPMLHEHAGQFTDTLYARMEQQNYGMIPYVSFRRGNPQSGIVAFMETARYSTGYASLKHTIGYMPETHMWKPYAERVASTYHLLQIFIDAANEQGADIHQKRKQIKAEIASQTEFVLSWQLDTTKSERIHFNGYVSGNKPSLIYEADRLFYDRNQPYTEEISYFNRYKPALSVQKPQAYIIPQAWENVVRLLALNGVKMYRLSKDQAVSLQMYYITDYQTGNNPYEGHYLHSRVQLEAVEQLVQWHEGDYVVPTDQEQLRYLIETLEPQGPDSYFAWNFFDSILSRKEYYSGYIFEDEAYEMLQKDPKLKVAFEKAKSTDEKLAASGRLQLDWIHKNSPYYEKTHMRYPIGRILNDILPF